LAHEGELLRQCFADADEAFDCLAKNEEPLSRLQASKKHDLFDRNGRSRRAAMLRNQFSKMIEEDDVRLDKGAFARNLISLRGHPAQKMQAAADNHVHELNAFSFRADFGNVVEAIERVGPVETVP